MWTNEISFEFKNSVKLSSAHTALNSVDKHEDNTSTIGGFIKNGKFGWVVHESNVEIFCVNTGDKVTSFNFNDGPKTKHCLISYIHEIHIPEIKSCLLAVGLQLHNNAGMVCILSGSRIVGRVEINEKVTCLQFISKDTCSRGVLNQYSGCIAVGTDHGKILLIDMCLRLVNDDIFGNRLLMNSLDVVQCHIELANVEPNQILVDHKMVQKEGLYFGLQLEIIEQESPILSLLEICQTMALVVGLADGRMLLYDLINLQAFHVAHPPFENTPLLNLTYIEPTDDPKACIYVWTYHAGSESAFAVMHSIMYEDKFADDIGQVYENFISCSPRLTLSCYDKGSIPLSCQTITKSTHQEEEVLTLCLLSWITSRKTTNVLVFDLNQWYKEEMPHVSDWREQPNHVVVLPIKGNDSLNVWMDVDSVMPFNSIQRPEEHFYPDSLRFDIKTLNRKSCNYYHWSGIQNQVIEHLENCGPTSILEPAHCFNQMLHAALIPQFCDYNYNSDTSKDVQREFLLSLALEYNCYKLLKECAIYWADGSHLGCEPENGVSLSTLTDWTWSRVKTLKDTSNNLCTALFDHSGRRIDYGTQKTLSHCSKQLKFLSELYEIILNNCQQYIPERVFKNLKSQSESTRMAAEYQEVLQWLLNVGLLPEGNINAFNSTDEFVLVPYPYERISSYYKSTRIKFFDEEEDQFDTDSPVDEQSCPFLYIDAFIKRECQGDLSKLWIENNGSAVYPPSSMQNALRTLLVPNVSIENKYILLIYVFMDINSILNEGRYAGIVQNLIKFPAVFKLNPAIIKRTQAFWFLDHGHLETAVDELISPLSHNKHMARWQREFLISSLLRQDAPNLALRVLRAPGLPISPFFEMKTLLANNLISEAFKLHRAKRDPALLREFFEGALKSVKHEMLLDLTLSEDEGLILRDYLSQTHMPQADNLHFIYLLQRSNFIEAIHLIDEMSKKKNAQEYNLDAPREVLSVFHSTLEPTTRHLSYMAYTDKKDYSSKQNELGELEPLSTSLIRSSNDMRNGLFQKSILGVREASDKLNYAQPFLEKPGFGIFGLRTQIQTNNVCYPIILNKKLNKRKLDADVPLTKSENQDIFSEFEMPRKKRRTDNDSMQPPSSRDTPRNAFTSFQDVRPSFNFSNTNEIGNRVTPDKLFSRSPSVQLTTPVVKRIRQDDDESPDSIQSYRVHTPHSILKTASAQSLLRRSVSPVSVTLSVFNQKSADLEEKSIRFDLPESPITEPKIFSPLLPPIVEMEGISSLNTSMISNEEFYSPEGSITMEVHSINDDSTIDIKDILTGGPKPRKSIRSRSTTPVECNIAILIEDVEDDVENKEQDDQHISQFAAQVDELEMFVDDEQDAEIEEGLKAPESDIKSYDASYSRVVSRAGPTPRKSLNRRVLETNARKMVDESVIGEKVQVSNSDVSVVLNESYENFLTDQSDIDQSWLERKQKFNTSSSTFNDSSMNILQKTHLLSDESDSENENNKKDNISDTSENTDSSDNILKESHFLSDLTDEIAASEGSDQEVEKIPEKKEEEAESDSSDDNEVINISSSESSHDLDSSSSDEVVETNPVQNEDMMELKVATEVNEPANTIQEEVQDVIIAAEPSSKLYYANIYNEDYGSLPELILEQSAQTYMGGESESPLTVQVLECDSSPEKGGFMYSTGNAESVADTSVAITVDESVAVVAKTLDTGCLEDESHEITVEVVVAENTLNVAHSESVDQAIPMEEDKVVATTSTPKTEKDEIAEDLSISPEEIKEVITSPAEVLIIPIVNDEEAPITIDNTAEETTKTNEDAAKDLSFSQSEKVPAAASGSKSPAQAREDVSKSENERKKEKGFGILKNAHEVDVAVMNLSVKPDEAHGANRKNKNDDKVIDTTALNLSTSQSDKEDSFEEEDNKVVNNSQTSTPSRFNLRKTRARSIDAKPLALDKSSPAKLTRATSVPKLLEIVKVDDGTPKTPTRRTRRSSMDAETSTPVSVMKSKIKSVLDKIDENQSSLDSTPRKTRRASTSNETSTPRTPVTRSRRLSIAETSNTPEMPGTPTRTRATSVTKETVGTPKLRKRKNSERSIEDDEQISIPDTKSEKSVGSNRSNKRVTTKKATEEPTAEVEAGSSTKSLSETFQEYSTSRRLTRHQSSVMEKTLALAKKIGGKSTRSVKLHVENEEPHSDSESVVSNVSNTSKTSRASRASRSKKRLKTDDSDAKSVASSTGTDKSESPNIKLNLGTILEEKSDDDQASNAPSTPSQQKRRGRQKKAAV